MKCFVERTKISTNVPFDLGAMKKYARIAHDDDDASLTRMGWEAAAEIEGLAGIALLRQSIRVTMLDVVLGEGLALPVGPVNDAATVSVTLGGEASTDFSAISGKRPYLSWYFSVRGSGFDRVVIEYEAGFGDAETDLPQDIRYAILDQGAVDFDMFPEVGAGEKSRSARLSRVAARYRGVSL